MSSFPDNLFPVLTPSAVDKFQVLGAVPGGMNQVIVFFEEAPLADDPEGADSVTNPANWTAVALDPSTPSAEDPARLFVPPGEAVPTYQPEVSIVDVDEDDDKQVHVRFNTPLETLVRVDLTPSSSIRTETCNFLVTTPTGDQVTTVQARGLFRGPSPEPRYVQEDVYRDLDFRFFPRDEAQAPATFRYDSNNDLGIQNSDASLQKRLLQRISTPAGAFLHLGSDYGSGQDLKTLARSGNLQALANRAAEQAKKEPDVQDAGAEARLDFASDGSAIVNLEVRVVRVDRRVSRFVFPLSIDSRST